MRTSFARLPVLMLFLLLAACVLPTEAHAQTTTTGSGTAYLVGWPDERADGDWYGRLRRSDLLAFIDTLTLGYAWRVDDGTPSLRITTAWTPGAGGILDGQRVKYELLPPDVRLVALAVDADVVVGGVRIGGLAVELDSLALAPAPEAYSFETGPLAWATLFTEASAATAQQAFAQGFTLENLRVRSVAFASGADDERVRGPYTVVNNPRAPRRVGVYTHEPAVFVDVRLGWLLGRPARAPRRTLEPRGERIGRGTLADGRTTRTRGGRAADGDTDQPDRGRAADPGAAEGERPATGDAASPDRPAVEETPRRGGLLDGLRGARSGDRKKDDDDEDEDDSNQLLPAGLVAVAAVGVLAYHTGTVGYLGQTRYAPIGVATGFVAPGGGVLLQAGVSEAVLQAGDGPRHGTAGVFVFRDLFGLPLQPAFGAGILATDEGDAVGLKPSLSLGAAFNRGPLVGLATYDVVNGGFALGAAFNFRARRAPR